MAEGLTLGKIVNFILIIIAALAVVGIVLIFMGIFKPWFIGFLTESDQNSLIKNGTITVSGDIPFYDEFTKTYKECKLSPETNCYCRITYPGTPTGYVLELDSSNEKTSLRLNGGAEVAGGDLFSWNTVTGDPVKLQKLDNVKEIRTQEIIIDNDNLNFENTGLFESASDSQGKLSLDKFTQVNKQYIAKKSLYSTVDVSGSNKKDIVSGLVLYKFDGKNSALYTYSSAVKDNLKMCNKIDNLNKASEEFNRLISTINNCINTKVLSNCKYVPAIPSNFKLVLENKKLNLKYNNEEIKSSKELTQDLCSFSTFKDLNPDYGTTLSTLEFSNYAEIDMYPSENKLCFLPYTLELAQQKKIDEERRKTITDDLLNP